MVAGKHAHPSLQKKIRLTILEGKKILSWEEGELYYPGMFPRISIFRETLFLALKAVCYRNIFFAGPLAQRMSRNARIMENYLQTRILFQRLPFGIPYYASSHPIDQEPNMGVASIPEYVNPKYAFGFQKWLLQGLMDPEDLP